MAVSRVITSVKNITRNRNGFTFLTAIFMVMMIGIMLGMTGQSWKMIMKREREKELLFRGSQIKEAIENWYDPKYSVGGKKWTGPPHMLVNLEDLLDSPYLRGASDTFRYLPQTYSAKLDEKDQKCTPDCPKLKIFQDPMTGKEWNIIKCDISSATNQICMKYPGANNAIIGVASKSEEEPLRTKSSFKDTALENMGTSGAASLTLALPKFGETVPPPPTTGSEMTKYSEWKFIADPKNDHTKTYKAYHEGL